MNLTNFLKQIDKITASYSKEQLASFIRDCGRTLPEHLREEFLKKLKAKGESDGSKIDERKMSDIEIGKIYNKIKKDFKLIESEDIYLTEILNEEYDDWYNPDADEFYYDDDYGISEMIEQACDFVHMCFDGEYYKEGYEVGRKIFSLEVCCSGEYEGGRFGIRDLVLNKIINYELLQLSLDALCCAYNYVPSEKRPEALYEIIKEGDTANITLEAIMQHGDEELPDFQDFLEQWIEYLGDMAGREPDRFFKEAAMLKDDYGAARGYAKKYVNAHPGLYLHIMENNNFSAENDMADIGLEAIDTIPRKYTVRSETALKTAASLVEGDGKEELVEKCYFAAYESCTNAVNYLRVLLNGYAEKRAELRAVFENVKKGEGAGYGYLESAHSRYAKKENRPDSNDILTLKFLDGQFDQVLSNGMNKSEPLGWSGTFMKLGISLYLLYLHEGVWEGRGISAIENLAKKEMGFSFEGYQRGLEGIVLSNEKEYFYNIFMKWKSMTKMEEDVKEKAIKKITGLLEKRTEGIMNANRRNYYGECAQFIAALGEVMESRGDRGAKQRLMTSYKDRYSHRNAFRAEMRTYGWIDIKRRK